MAATNTPRGVQADTTNLNPVEVRINGGMLALNRFLMTLQNKRMPVASFTVGRDGGGMRATILLDCAPEQARRYTTLLSALEDVEEIGAVDQTVEVALLKVEGSPPYESARRAGVEVHEEGETLVASGEPERLKSWLAEIKDSLEDMVRLGPVARPGGGGGLMARGYREGGIGSASRGKAENEGLSVMNTADAVRWADVVMMLLPDERQPAVFEAEVAPNLSEGMLLLFAHGFNIHFNQITVPPEVDLGLVAPKGPGHVLRRLYTESKGMPALFAVGNDASGEARDLILSYARGIGSGRAGIIETTFAEETETDLFGEQAVLCGGLTALLKAGVDTLVEAGYQPELAYYECVNELKLIVDLIYEGGLAQMRYSISNTAEYGDYTAGPKIIDDAAKERMRQILADIQSGKWAKDWVLENQAGGSSFLAMRRREAETQVEKVGQELRALAAEGIETPAGSAGGENL